MKSLTYGDMPESRTGRPTEARGSRIGVGLREREVTHERRRDRSTDSSWEHLLSRRLALFKLVASQF
ncbi:MAG: hypothetical protein VKP72_04230 [bacterium]|nr:hypothetical protein [bacterium]